MEHNGEQALISGAARALGWQSPGVVADAVLCALSATPRSVLPGQVIVPRNEPSWP